MHTKEPFNKLFPVLSDHFFSERASPQSSASSEASSRDGLILDTLTGHPRVAVQIERKDVLGFTLNIHAKNHQMQEIYMLSSTEANKLHYLMKLEIQVKSGL